MSSHRRYIDIIIINYYIIIHEVLYYLSLILVTSKKSQDYMELENINNIMKYFGIAFDIVWKIKEVITLKYI